MTRSALEALRFYCKTSDQKYVTTDDTRPLIDPPLPKENRNTIGAAFRCAHQQGLIRPTGIFVYTTHAEGKRRRVQLWEIV